MNDFPRMLYRAGGTEEIHGGRFSTLIVHDTDELEAALADGWSLTTGEALEVAKPKMETKAYADGSSATGVAPLPELSPAEQEKLDNAPPTRAELEQKAHELNIEFKPNIGDKKLAERIEAALAAKG